MTAFVGLGSALAGGWIARRCQACTARRSLGFRAARGRVHAAQGRDDALERAAKEYLKKIQRDKERKLARQKSADAAKDAAAAKSKHQGQNQGKKQKNPDQSSKGPAPFRPDKICNIRFLGGFVADPPRSRIPEIAFIGRSNVGKSSCINCLVPPKKAIARTSKRPGRTQQINLFPLADENDIDMLTLADLPGYGFAKISSDDQRKIEKFVEGYLTTRENLKLVVVLVDCRRDPQDTDLSVINVLRQIGRKFVIVFTKIDTVTPSQLSTAADRFRAALGFTETDEELIFFSAVTGQGKGLIWKAVQETLK